MPAGRSVWLAAVSTGAGTALVGAVVAIGVVAVCWLPASGGSGHAWSAIRAGLLSFLASVHGGITIDGAPAAFVPLGMTILLGLIAWRAGVALADATADDVEDDVMRHVLVGLAQVASFTITCLIAVPIATLGTSDAPFLGVGFFATILFTLTGGLAYVRKSALAPLIGQRVPSWVATAARAGLAGMLVYATAGALLVASSLVYHHAQVTELARQAGPGWNSAPVLLLCILAAPNAVIAGAAYLAGPGFAFGSGTTVAVGATTHGVLPAFPLLAALPSGASPTWMWWPVIIVPVACGVAAAARAYRADGWLARVRDLGAAVVLAGCAAAVLAWQGGGGIGTGRLHTIGGSPWLFGLTVAGELAAGGGVVLALLAGWTGVKEFLGEMRRRDESPAPVGWAKVVDAPTQRLSAVEKDAEGSGRLAG